MAYERIFWLRAIDPLHPGSWRVYRHIFDGQFEQSGFSLTQWADNRIASLRAQGWKVRPDLITDEAEAAFRPARGMKTTARPEQWGKKGKPAPADHPPGERYLGRLCPQGHDHEGTGQSLRHSSGRCVLCLRESSRQSRKRKHLPKIQA